MSNMMRVAVGDKTFRTKSVDRVARRLYGVKAQAVVRERRNGKIYGWFVTPDRNNPALLHIRARFEQEDPAVADETKSGKKEPTKIVDEEGHHATVYR